MSIKYKRFSPTEYVMKIKKGKVAEKGLGLSFFYNTMTTSMLVMPATAMDSAFAFDDIMTSDFQAVNVQGDITYIINNYEKASKMVNFFYSGSSKEYEQTLITAKNNMSKRITNLAKVIATKFLSTKDIKTAVKSSEELAAFLKESMKNNESITEFGLEIVSVSILGISATAETRRALEAATREEILKQQDDAIYKRRNSAIEQECKIRENELNTEIKVAVKEKEKSEKEMETKRLLQEKQAQLDAVKVDNRITLEQRNTELVRLETENQKKRSAAKAYETELLINAFRDVDAEVIKSMFLSGIDAKSLIANAFVEIGKKADKIGSLNVSPELLESLFQK